MLPTPKNLRTSLKLTKIVCTIGPATNSQIYEMLDSGMSVLRINLSHIKSSGELEEIFQSISKIKDVGERFFGVAVDTRGPEIRLQISEPRTIQQGELLTFSNDTHADCFGYFDFPNLKAIKPGFIFTIDDGCLRIKVKEVKNNVLHCVSLSDYNLGQNKGVGFPGINLGVSYLNERDIADIKIGLENHVDFIFASFVSCVDDILEIRELIGENGPLIIAKIESKLGMKNLDAIIDEADGIMVARGDLGAEIPFYDLLKAQKIITNKCKHKKKPVIIATQMMESMVKEPYPTRAEITDVGNSVLDCADAVMLSSETSIGKWPIKCVETMAEISISCEKYGRSIQKNDCRKDIRPLFYCNEEVKYIICVSKNRKDIVNIYDKNNWIPVIVVSPDLNFLRSLSIFRGLIPYKTSIDPFLGNKESYQSFVEDVISFLKVRFGAEQNDVVVVYCRQSDDEEEIKRIKI